MQVANYARGRGRNYVRVVGLDLVERQVSTQEIFEKFGVWSIIRIPEKDYPDDSFKNSVFTHFGLPISDDSPGTLAVLAKIVRNGFFRSFEDDLPPLLSFENAWTCEVVKCVQLTAYASLPSDCFVKSVGNIKDVPSLKKALVNRYAHVLKNLDEEQILGQGVSIRYLRII